MDGILISLGSWCGESTLTNLRAVYEMAWHSLSLGTFMDQSMSTRVYFPNESSKAGPMYSLRPLFSPTPLCVRRLTFLTDP